MFCFVNLFRSILPVVPTECDVLTVCRQHNDKEWKFKEQHAKMWENIAGAKDTLAPVVSTLRGRAPRRSDASGPMDELKRSVRRRSNIDGRILAVSRSYKA